MGVWSHLHLVPMSKKDRERAISSTTLQEPRECVCVCVYGRPEFARPCYNTVDPPGLKGPTAAPSSMLAASPSSPRAPPPNQKEQDILNPAGWMEHLARQPASLTQSSSPGDPSPGYSGRDASTETGAI